MLENTSEHNVLISEICLQNFLSFGPDAPPIKLGPLSVLVGANGSGKSNLIEAISLLKALPRDVRTVISKGGGVEEWIWKGAPDRAASLEVSISATGRFESFQHSLSFNAVGQFFNIDAESIVGIGGDREDGILYQNGNGVLNYRSKANSMEPLQKMGLRADQSIMSQVGVFEDSPLFYPLVTSYSSIRIYREWHFGRGADYRRPVAADLSSDHLEEDLSNLGLFLNRILSVPKTKARFIELLRDLYDGLTDIHFSVIGGTVQVNLVEEDFSIPAIRLSDGTLRYLCLLAILVDPNPPRLICLEEPELGLHPDLIHKVADLIVEASGRTQLIVTTHSVAFLDAITDRGESVIVFDKVNGATNVEYPKPEWLATWLESYSLGQIWSKNLIGGNRW